MADDSFVYFLPTKDFKYLKVGYTKNFNQRFRNIQSGCPFELWVWISIITDKPQELEKRAHDLLKHCHFRGEWFTPSSDDFNMIMDFAREENRKYREAYLNG